MKSIFTDAKKFGFGMMRLPVQKDGSIDYEQCIDMTDVFLNAGFRYFDSAYFYHEGESEVLMGKALSQRYPRDRFLLADKLPGWALRSSEEADEVLKEQLRRAQTDYFDYYLLHSVKKSTRKAYEKNQCFEWIKRKKEEGKARYIGFSYHDSAEMLDELLTRYPFFDFVQLQINYFDWENPTIDSRGVYEVARKHEKPISVMEPLKGGMLVSLNDEMQKILKDAGAESPASFGLRYVQSLPGVEMVLSGMSSLKQMTENVKDMVNSRPFSRAELEAAVRITDILKQSKHIPCSDCRYCVAGCPKDIYIPKMIEILNHTYLFGVTPATTHYLKQYSAGRGTASDCISCKKCERTCPQHLQISQFMQELAQTVKAHQGN